MWKRFETHSRSKIVTRATKRTKFEYYCINSKNFFVNHFCKFLSVFFASARIEKCQTFSDQTQPKYTAINVKNCCILLLFGEQDSSTQDTAMSSSFNSIAWHRSQSNIALLTSISSDPFFVKSKINASSSNSR